MAEQAESENTPYIPKTRSEIRISRVLDERGQTPQELATTYITDSIQELRESSKRFFEKANKPVPEGRLKYWLWKKMGSESGRESDAQTAQSLEDKALGREELIAETARTGDFGVVEDILAKDAKVAFGIAEFWLHGEDSSYGKAANFLDEGFMALSILDGLNPDRANEVRKESKPDIDKVERRVAPVNTLMGIK